MILKRKVLGIIPARFESSRFPGKPLALILGKTLIQRTYENALLCKLLDAVVVATDDERILNHVLSFNGQAVMTSKNCLTGTDRIAEAVQSNELFKEFDLVINIQGDEPCIEPLVIEQVIKALDEADLPLMSSVVMKLVCEEEAFNPSIVKCVFDSKRNALYFSRALIPSSKIPEFKKDIAYYRHLGIYGYRRDFLINYAKLNETPLQMAEDLEQLKVLEHGVPIRLAIVTSKALGVDTPEDIKKVEDLLCKQNSYSSQAEFVPL